MGQIALPLRHCIKADKESIIPAKIKTAGLCREKMTSCGTADN
jgi:hypothetical protein